MDKEKIKQKLEDLIEEGANIHFAGAIEYDANHLKKYGEETQEKAKEAVKNIEFPKIAYHTWYDKACSIVRIFSPRRLEEFERFYTGDKTIKKVEDLNDITAGVTHYLQDIFFTQNGKKNYFFDTFVLGVNAQRRILTSIFENIDNPLFNMESDIQYGIYESEMDIARELKEQGFLRAAGSIAGVVLEVHLKQVVINRNIPLDDDKKNMMSDYNNMLKRNGVYNKITSSLIKTCNDIRNKCVHPDKDDPTDGEISTIISTAERIIGEIK